MILHTPHGLAVRGRRTAFLGDRTRSHNWTGDGTKLGALLGTVGGTLAKPTGQTLCLGV